MNSDSSLDEEEEKALFFRRYVPPGYTGYRKFFPRRSREVNFEETAQEIPKENSSEEIVPVPQWIRTYKQKRPSSSPELSSRTYRPAGYGGHVPFATSKFAISSEKVINEGLSEMRRSLDSLQSLQENKTNTLIAKRRDIFRPKIERPKTSDYVPGYGGHRRLAVQHVGKSFGRAQMESLEGSEHPKKKETIKSDEFTTTYNLNHSPNSLVPTCSKRYEANSSPTGRVVGYTGHIPNSTTPGRSKFHFDEEMRSKSSTPKRIETKVLFASPENYRIPGYSGHIPQGKEHFGKTFSELLTPGSLPKLE